MRHPLDTKDESSHESRRMDALEFAIISLLVVVAVLAFLPASSRHPRFIGTFLTENVTDDSRVLLLLMMAIGIPVGIVAGAVTYATSIILRRVIPSNALHSLLLTSVAVGLAFGFALLVY